MPNSGTRKSGTRKNSGLAQEGYFISEPELRITFIKVPVTQTVEKDSTAEFRTHQLGNAGDKGSRKDYLYKRIQEENCLSGIRIPMKNYFMGRFMHCVYPSYLLRFVKKENTYWPSSIHSQPQIKGKIEVIPSNRKDLAFIHLANDSVSTNIRKTNQYTDNELDKRKNNKYPFWSLIGETTFRFFKLYILKGGFRDGKAGLTYCGLNAFYKFATIAKIWESRISENEIDPELK